MALGSLLGSLGIPAPARPRVSVVERLGITDRALDTRDTIFESIRSGGKAAVGDSSDLERIVALPRRPRPTLEEQQRMAVEMTVRLCRPNPACRCAELRPGIPNPCIMHLLPVQGWYLYEAAQVGGAVGHIVVGGGKTGIDILLAMVVPGVKRAVLMIPPNLKTQFLLDFDVWAQHFEVPNLAGGAGPFDPRKPVLTLLPYSVLSRPEHAMRLKAEAPEIIIADEGQNLKDRKSARTGRFLRYFAEAEQTRFFVHSGSLTTRSLDDYAHLSALALLEGSPLPLESSTVREWCSALDPVAAGGTAAPIGSLRKLCDPGERARDGFRRRLLDTHGVISTEDAQLPIALRVIQREVALPDEVKEMLRTTRERAQRPDGEELVEETEVVATLRQLAAGFFYRWKYPRGEPEKLILDWFAKRQAWFRDLRQQLQFRRDFMDSPKLCSVAAERYWTTTCDKCGKRFGSHHRHVCPVSVTAPTWDAPAWPAWSAIADQVQPEQDTIWVDEFLARDAVAWSREAPGIVWYGLQHAAFGRKVAELGGLPFYGQGAEASAAIAKENGSRSIVASIKAHGTGKNLQMFRRNLVANPPSDGGTWEQLIGRTHRYGQAADAVEVFVYRHTTEVAKALSDARDYARYVQQTTGKAEKLLYAEYSWAT